MIMISPTKLDQRIPYFLSLSLCTIIKIQQSL